MCSLCSIHDYKVGVASLYVASKCEEYYPAELKKLVHLTENSYSVQDVFDMELVLLGVIHFQAGFLLFCLCIDTLVVGVCAHPSGLPTKTLQSCVKTLNRILGDMFLFGK